MSTPQQTPARRVRTFVRGTLAVGILLFAWFAISQVADHAAGSAATASAAACLLVLLMVALRRAS